MWNEGIKDFLIGSLEFALSLSADNEDDVKFVDEINKEGKKCADLDSLSAHSMLTPLKTLLSKKSLIETKSDAVLSYQCVIDTIDKLTEIDGPERVKFWQSYREPMQNGVDKMAQSEKLEDFVKRIE